MARLETLFLDAGGVLVNPDWQRVSQALAERGLVATGQDLEAAEPHAKHELDTPERIERLSDASRGWLYFNLVLRGVGIEPSPATDEALIELREYHNRHNLWNRIPGDTTSSLERLRRMGLRLVVVSNSNGTLSESLTRMGLRGFFELLVDSHEEGVEKPDPRLFQIALERSGAAAESTLHVGDLYNVDVVGARAAGLDAMLLDVADLYPDADCRRVPSLSALADQLEVTLT